MNNRRDFLQKSGLLAAGAALPSAATRTKMKFIHHVLFWAKNPGNQAEVSQLKNAIIELGKLPMIENVHVGSPVVTDFDKSVTDGSYSISVVMVFESAEKENEYLHHPLHLKFINENKHLWGKVVVTDSVE
ncbi:MAG: hypothetical protein RJA76_1750 [Bacteroidota bacterium]|jgi:hypothetical protein